VRPSYVALKTSLVGAVSIGLSLALYKLFDFL